MKLFFQKLAPWIAYLYLPVLLIPIVLTRTTRELDRDEGINLVKGVLINRGFSIKEDFWSDQPPFYPQLISAIARYFPGSLDAARTFSILLVALLFWSLFEYLSLYRGRLVGLTAVFVLGSFSYVFRYAGAVMIGLPCLTFGMLGLLSAAVAVRKERLLFAALSGAFLTFSVATKLYGGAFLFPILILALADRQNRFEFFKIFALGGMLATLYVLLLAPGILSIDLLSSHVGAMASNLPTGLKRLRTITAADRPYLWIAFFGLLAVRRHRYLLQILVLLLVVTLFLYLHRPVWNHHYPLLALPLSVLVTEGFFQLLELLKRTSRWRALCLVGMVIVTLIFVSLISYKTTYNRNRIQRVGHRLYPELIPIIQHEMGDNGEFFTDRPVYVFLSGAAINPRHGVVTTKRLRTGELLQGDLMAELKLNKPKLVLLNRFPKMRGNFMSTFGKNYQIIWQREDAVLLRRKEEQDA